MNQERKNALKRFLKLKSYIFLLRIVPLLFRLRSLKSNNECLRSTNENLGGPKLDLLLQQHGSDKASMHDYWKIYEEVFHRSRTEKGILLEIGLGTNNPDIPSNMGGYFKPGGSLRAWQEYFEEFEILGADIDREILFSENRIRTFWLDQLNGKSFQGLHNYLKNKSLDFIIIDGLHQPFADLNSLVELLPYLKKDGHLL